MEANICDVNHLDADVLLPPRKRLLAGLKKQSSDGDNTLQLSLVPASSSPASPSSASASVLASSSHSSSDFNTRLNNLLSSHNANLSPEEIVEASKLAASAAVKAAETAKVAAEEKAAIAVKAVAAAKSALDMVASFSEEADCKERYLKKNKLKKHVPVQLLYKKYQPVENCRKDEELARKLHRAINSSPRISKNSSDLKGHKHKKPKISSTSQKAKSNGGVVLEQSPTATCNGHADAGELDSEGTIQESYKDKAYEKVCVYDKTAQLEMDYGEAESSQMSERTLDDMSLAGKKRGRVKLKKLPLSICTFKDQANPKEETGARNSPLADLNMGNPTGGSNMPLFTMEPSTEGVMPIETTSGWKCQEYKAPACVKQNKVVQS